MAGDPPGEFTRSSLGFSNCGGRLTWPCTTPCRVWPARPNPRSPWTSATPGHLESKEPTTDPGRPAASNATFSDLACATPETVASCQSRPGQEALNATD